MNIVVVIIIIIIIIITEFDHITADTLQITFKQKVKGHSRNVR